MTATITDLSTNTWDDLRPTCESKHHEGGDSPATHIDIRWMCGCQVLKCDGCAAIARSEQGDMGVWYCAYCKETWGSGLLGDFTRIEPL